MSPLQKALDLESAIIEDQGNHLALEVIEFANAQHAIPIDKVSGALINIAGHRLSGVGFSSEVSNIISTWLQHVFNENHPNVNQLIELMHELTSNQSGDVIKKIYHSTKNEKLKEQILHAYSYRGT